MSLSFCDSSTLDRACLAFTCPTTGQPFHDAQALVQTVAGVTIAQARCPHCSAAQYLDGHVTEEAWPQVHGFLLNNVTGSLPC
jgi:hypothetical protein